jgi:hypothetical protein
MIRRLRLRTTEGTGVELESDIKSVRNQFLTGDWLKEFGNSKALQDLDEDSGNSSLSIIEIPHLRAAAGCC